MAASKKPAKKTIKTLPPRKDVKGGRVNNPLGWTSNHNLTLVAL